MSTSALFGFKWIDELGKEKTKLAVSEADGYPNYLYYELLRFMHDHSPKELLNLLYSCDSFSHFPMPWLSFDKKTKLDEYDSIYGNYNYVYIFNIQGELIEFWKGSHLVYKNSERLEVII